MQKSLVESVFGHYHLGPPLSEEQRFNVGATAFNPPAVRKMRLDPMPSVSPPPVRDNPDGLVAELISPNVVVEIYFITSDDDEPA